MKKIIPHLWFDKEAKDAAAFYTSVFPDSRVTYTGVITGTPSGDCDVVSFEVMGTSFQAISAGPVFPLNPAISFLVNFDLARDPAAHEHIDTIWEKLSEGGRALMPLDAYPFSKRYGWIQDKYGVSWQLMLTDPEGEERPPIIPYFLFTKDKAGKAEEASSYYLSVFKDTKRGTLVRHPAGSEPEKEGTIMFTDFMLAGQWFAAMDSALPHPFTFNEAISLIVECETQEEIDYYWEKLSAVPEAEQCGWVKDAYGVSWQIVPAGVERYMTGDVEAVKRATAALLSMKKIDMAALKTAYEGA